jgi:hypothetical protein
VERGPIQKGIKGPSPNNSPAHPTTFEIVPSFQPSPPPSKSQRDERGGGDSGRRGGAGGHLRAHGQPYGKARGDEAHAEEAGWGPGCAVVPLRYQARRPARHGTRGEGVSGRRIPHPRCRTSSHAWFGCFFCLCASFVR